MVGDAPMTALPPSPFISNSAASDAVADTAAAAMPHCPQAAAVFLYVPLTTMEAPQEAPAVAAANLTAAGDSDEHRFVLDEAAFMAELADETVREMLKQQMPVFLRAPSEEFLQATTGE